MDEGNDTKSAIVSALMCMDAEGEKKSIKDVLARSLCSDDVAVCDSKDDDFGGVEKPGKKRRGRPRKEEVEGRIETAARANGLASKALRDEELRRKEKFNRINPHPSADRRRWEDLAVKLQRARYAIEPYNDDATVAALGSDLKSLCREAGIKDYTKLRGWPEYKEKWDAYRGVCEAAAEEYAAALAEHERGELDEVEELLEGIFARGKQMEKWYEEALKALQSLTDDLCQMISRGDLEKGLKAGGLKEVEKVQYAPLPGENSQSYQKRMKGIGGRKSIPETIKNLDSVVETVERRWRRVAAITPDEFKVVKDNWRKTIQNLLARASLGINAFPETISAVLEAPLRSDMEVRAKKGKAGKSKTGGEWKIINGTARSPRLRFTENVFGTGRELSPDHYERYGCLHAPSPSESDFAIGGQYGRNVIRWKKGSVLATFFCGDSVCLGGDGLNYCTCSLLSDPSPASFNPESREIIEELKSRPLNVGLETFCHLLGIPYVEIQIHGNERPTAEDVESIAFCSDTDVEFLSPSAVQSILDNGIRIFVGEDEYTMAEDGSLEEMEEKGEPAETQDSENVV